MEALEEISGAPVESGIEPTTEREPVRKRLQDRRDFGLHVVVFVVVNAFLVAAWAITGSGYFWPAWVLAAWASDWCCTPGRPSCIGR